MAVWECEGGCEWQCGSVKVVASGSVSVKVVASGSMRVWLSESCDNTVRGESESTMIQSCESVDGDRNFAHTIPHIFYAYMC